MSVSDNDLRARTAREFPTAGRSGLRTFAKLARRTGFGGAEIDGAEHWTALVPLLVASRDPRFIGLLLFTSGQQWRDLLPAYITAAIDIGLNADGPNLPLGTLSSLLSPKASSEISGPDMFEERTAGLTDDQRAVVRDFVHLMIQAPEISGDRNGKSLTDDLVAAWSPA